MAKNREAWFNSHLFSSMGLKWTFLCLIPLILYIVNVKTVQTTFGSTEQGKHQQEEKWLLPFPTTPKMTHSYMHYSKRGLIWAFLEAKWYTQNLSVIFHVSQRKAKVLRFHVTGPIYFSDFLLPYLMPPRDRSICSLWKGQHVLTLPSACFAHICLSYFVPYYF